MTYRPPARSARARAASLWDADDERSDAELAAELGVTARTLRAYHQAWNRKNGKQQHGGRKLPDEVVVAILEMHNHAGMAFPAIAEAVKEDYGYDVGAEHVRKCYRRGIMAGTGQVVDVQEEDLPLATLGGFVRTVPETVRGPCGRCRHYEACRGLARGLVPPCERPLDWEVMM